MSYRIRRKGKYPVTIPDGYLLAVGDLYSTADPAPVQKLEQTISVPVERESQTAEDLEPSLAHAG